MMLKNIFKKRLGLHKLGRLNKGVSLIELLVVIAIFMIISSMTIFSHNDFKSSLSIQNLADDIALSVRKAQNYAIGAVGASGYFTYGYGINFSINSNRSSVVGTKKNPIPVDNSNVGESSNSKSFILFVDRNNSGFYNKENTVVCDGIDDPRCLEYLEILSITSNDFISGISIKIKDQEIKLEESDQIDLLFKRPNPEPTFCYRIGNASECDENSNLISNIKIKISSERDRSIFKIITISNNGQISSDF